MKQKVLFLCTHNSARSQMAEGLLRHLGGDRFESYSAGTEQTRVHPQAIRAMADLGVDLSSYTSKLVDAFRDQQFDYVITVCDRANETCPFFPSHGKRLHWSFEDPSAAKGSADDQLAEFRRIRDQIRARIEQELLNA